MSDHRLTVNTQQLLDVLIIAIAEKAKDDTTITVEEIHQIIIYFDQMITDLIEGDTEEYDPIISKPDADLDEDDDYDPNVPE